MNIHPPRYDSVKALRDADINVSDRQAKVLDRLDRMIYCCDYHRLKTEQKQSLRQTFMKFLKRLITKKSAEQP